MKDLTIPYLSSILNIVLTSIQDNPVYQIVGLILTILSLCVSILYTIFKWYNDAKKDGQITSEEYEKLLEKLDDLTNKKGE